MAKKAKKKGADNDFSIVRLGGSEITPKATKKAKQKTQGKRGMEERSFIEGVQAAVGTIAQGMMSVTPEFRISYRAEGSETYYEDVVILAENEAEAVKRFFQCRSSYRIIKTVEIPNVDGLKRELAELKAKLKECQRRKKPASRKKAKTSKKS